MSTEPKWTRIYTLPAGSIGEMEGRAEVLNVQARTGGREGVALAEWRARITPEGATLESRPLPYNLAFKSHVTGWKDGRGICLHCGAQQDRPYTGERGTLGVILSGTAWAKRHKPWCPGPLEPRYTAPPLNLGPEISDQIRKKLGRLS